MEFANRYNVHANDSKTSLYPLCFCVIVNGVLTYFFGLYWLHNPDVYPAQIFGGVI